MYYKYFTYEGGIDFLKKRRMMFSPPKFCNDINEFTPSYYDSNNKKNIERYFLDKVFVNNLYNALKVTLGYKKNFDEFMKEMRSNNEIVHIAIHNIDKSMKVLCNNFKKTMSDYIGVFCLTTIWNSNLMWSHYADSHKGFCIGFTIDKTEIDAIRFDDVKYRKRKYQLPIDFIFENNDERQMQYVSIALRKEKDWGYEKEKRIIVNLSDCINKDDRYFHVMEFNDIKEILIGINTVIDETAISQLKDYAKHAGIFRIIRNSKDFELSRNELTREYKE
jgi:hypothetical protein